MLRSAPTQVANRSQRVRFLHAERRLTVCVVDGQPNDYDAWQMLARDECVQLSFVPTANAALRHSRTERVDLWVLNATLPDLGGAELCSMLRAQSNTGAVVLVTDDYTSMAEQAAWRAGASLFLCKPAHLGALAGWLERARGVPTAGAGPARKSD